MSKELDIRIQDFTYELPEENIARYPLSKRDESKLLIYNSNVISEDTFKSLPSHISENSLMIFNDTKVVPARLFFKKDSGAVIQIFCLEPHNPVDYATAFASKNTSEWKVIVGNIKKWKDAPIYIMSSELDLQAELVQREENSAIVRFTWSGDLTFSEVLEECGNIPIPPYLQRDTEAIDLERYQTLYAKYKGSVAAPTAGLHFTEQVLEELKGKNVDIDNVCLHVGAGTFLPVKSEYINEHTMHKEPFSVKLSLLKKIYNHPENQKIVAVGTTSVRTLESLYYLGKQCIIQGKDNWSPNLIEQWVAYQGDDNISLKDSMAALIEYLEERKLDILEAKTQIIIVPGYEFKVVDAMVTNFHQPQSTLLLLISAFIGDKWKDIYKYALENNFRFLSYGDSSYLIR